MRFGAACFWILVWELAARWYDNSLILASPSRTAATLAALPMDPAFRLAIASSSARIVTGFAGALVFGVFFAFLASRSSWLAALLDPPLHLIRSTPIASVTILILLWVGSRNLSVIVSFISVVPIVYLNTLAGIRSLDPKLREMATVFRLPFGKRLRYILLSTVFPYFRAAVSAGLGFCWKSGVAAEVIGIPSNSIGEKLYLAKIYLSTGELFAWTAVVILLSYLFERISLAALARAERWLTKASPISEDG